MAKGKKYLSFLSKVNGFLKNILIVNVSSLCWLSLQTSLSKKDLRADVCKYQPEVCNSEKLKILKKIHNIAYGKLLQEIHVLLRSDNYF